MRLPQTPFSFILYFVRQQWRLFSFITLASVIWALSDALFPYLLKLLINTVADYHGERAGIYTALSGVLVTLVLFWSVSEVVTRAQGIAQIYIFPVFRSNIRLAVLNYVKSHSHSYFANSFAGNLAKKLSDLPTSCQTLVDTICFQFVTATTGAILVLVMMFSIKWIFGVILITWLCLHLGLVFLMLKKSQQLWEIHSDAASILSGKIVDTFSNILNVRLFVRHRYESEYLEPFQKDEIIKAKKAMWLVEKMRIGFGLSGLFLIFAMIFTLVHGWIQGWVSIGDFTQVGMQAFWILGWIWHLSFQMTIFSRELGVVSDALNLIRKQHDVVDKPKAKSLTIAHGKIEFQNVYFAYREKHWVFADLNVTIPAGQKVGLVGFSGSGKTTFVNLTLRFFDINSGKILIDDQVIADVHQDSLRQHITMIPQEPTLFHRSLLENIRYGNLDASIDEVLAVSKLAHCHEFIEQLDDKYDSLVGERGIKLSGGQRQRIAIARAMLKNAPILILDEATSALDSVTEKLIQESLHTLMQGKTTIVVAHRLSTLADMDRILVFDKGQIIEDGDIQTLLAQQGHFAKLWQMQVNGFLPEAG